MKTTFTIIISVLTMALFGQDRSKRVCFKTTYFAEDGLVFKTTLDTILVNQTLDIDFYNKHFNQPFYYPNPLINSQYKDTTIIVWRDTLNKKDFKTNWAYTTIYDNQSRAIKYIYSGCLICSQFPFNVKLFYDKTNRPIRIEKRYGIGYKIAKDKLVKSVDKGFPEDDYRIKYNLDGDIIQLRCFKNGKRNIQIDKM